MTDVMVKVSPLSGAQESLASTFKLVVPLSSATVIKLVLNVKLGASFTAVTVSTKLFVELFAPSSAMSVIVEVPNELVEFIEDNPLIWPNCRSSGVVIDETITSALAPGYCVVTWIVGKSTVGRAEIGRSL